jgi:hypothetical protein
MRQAKELQVFQQKRRGIRRKKSKTVKNIDPYGL